MHSYRVLAKALKTRFIDQKPFVLSHLITARCNADCLTCLWKKPSTAQADELSTSEVEALYRDAVRAGFLSLVLWGGEPFVRRDLGHVLRFANGIGLNTTLITNGWWLEERADETLPWVNRLVVSVDALGEMHDYLRRCSRLFERLERGLRLVQAGFADVEVVLITVVSRLNLPHLEAIAAFGQSMRAAVVFQAMNEHDYGSSGRRSIGPRLRLTPVEARRASVEIRNLRRQGYPVRDSNAYLAKLGRDVFRYRCHYKKVVLRVEDNGDVLDCTKTACPLINVRRTCLAAFLDSSLFRDFLRRAERCDTCHDAGVVETSHIWEGGIEALRHAADILV
jgi:MoaA/NifB/PqqE/SkfB family radical SAM enzyme